MADYLPRVKAEMNWSEEIERLRERCEGYKGQVLTGSIEIERLRAQNAELLEVLERLIENVETGSYESTGQAIQEARTTIAKAKGMRDDTNG